MERPDKFITIKQPAGSRVCAAAVAAMATGRDLGYVESQMRPSFHADGQPYYCTEELLSYLGANLIFAGLICSTADTMGFDPRKAVSVVPLQRTAIITVPSREFCDAHHYVFFDGAVVRDPLPEKPDEGDIADYICLALIPLTYQATPTEE